MIIESSRVRAAFAIAALALCPVEAGPGAMVVWGGGPGATAPEGEFRALASGGGSQALAIKADETLFLSTAPTQDAIPPIPLDLKDVHVKAVGMGRNHGMAVDLDGKIRTWGLRPTAFAGAPTNGGFVAVTGGGSHSVALHSDGSIVQPDACRRIPPNFLEVK